MNNCPQPLNLNRFIKSALLRDITYNAEVELRGWDAWVRSFDGVGFLLGPDGRDNCVSMFEEDVEDMGCYEARTACVRVVRYWYIVVQIDNNGVIEG